MIARMYIDIKHSKNIILSESQSHKRTSFLNLAAISVKRK